MPPSDARSLIEQAREQLSEVSALMNMSTTKHLRRLLSQAQLKLDRARVLLREGDISGTREET